MATSTLLPFNIVNMALRMLGDDSITALQFATPTLRRAQIAAEYYDTVRDATLNEHPWNFATKRVVLTSYTLPTSTLALSSTAVGSANFTTGANEFVATDVGREIRAIVGTGRATITVFNAADDVDVNITTAFDTTSYVTGDYRMYWQFPAWGFTRSIPVPSDCLRVWRLENNETYQVEQGFIVIDMDTLRCRYTRQENDTTKYPFPFVLAFATHLAAIMAEPLTGQNTKGDLFLKKYQMQLLRAKGLDAQEGTAESFESDALIDVRR